MRSAPLKHHTLGQLQRQTFQYFVHEVNPHNGLVADKSKADSPASIAAVGFALSCYPVGVHRGFMSRADAVARVLATLRFFHESIQSPETDATGYKGFYYHFLDMKTGRRAENCELSTFDTALLLGGILVAGAYFDGTSKSETEIRRLARQLCERTDWNWARNNGRTVTHGWRPESGFLPDRWEGYCEALMLYILALGSSTHPIPASCYKEWCSTYQWKNLFGYQFLYAGPLFIHQYSHAWIDFRNIQDEFMRGHGIDYFENSRRATHIQREYAMQNPLNFKEYGENCWGITASDGPGPTTHKVRDKKRHFFGYIAREVPDGPDDGTIAPWAVVASLPFAPEIVLPALRYFEKFQLRMPNRYGYKGTFNPSFPAQDSENPFWISPYHFALNQGPIILMIENFRSGLLWRLTRQIPTIIRGLQHAGFTGGWLDHKSP